MPDQQKPQTPADKLDPEEAKMVIKAIEEVEKEEAEAQTRRATPEDTSQN